MNQKTKAIARASAISALIAIAAAHPAYADDKHVYAWTCKTKAGEVVQSGIHSVPFRVGQVVEATVPPLGMGTGIRDDGACSQIRFDLSDGRTAICEPTGIPDVHKLIGGWSYKPTDKSKCHT
ncbi:hypothetical protein [Ralstonia insidiosa]|jgi:hypothetical protein|nr:hypothetical protein [Ralstonia insidiosa]MBA9940562.1 hypothetical protein [Ralstonia insidiosa]MBC9968986.1 hypothetical protein [Ralstonia insidiosa]MBX3905069.1 hypothetical protein [Ralstonia insidiosa]